MNISLTVKVSAENQDELRSNYAGNYRILRERIEKAVSDRIFGDPKRVKVNWLLDTGGWKEMDNDTQQTSPEPKEEQTPEGDPNRAIWMVSSANSPQQLVVKLQQLSDWGFSIFQVITVPSTGSGLALPDGMVSSSGQQTYSIVAVAPETVVLKLKLPIPQTNQPKES